MQRLLSCCRTIAEQSERGTLGCRWRGLDTSSVNRCRLGVSLLLRALPLCALLCYIGSLRFRCFGRLGRFRRGRHDGNRPHRRRFSLRLTANIRALIPSHAGFIAVRPRQWLRRRFSCSGFPSGEGH